MEAIRIDKALDLCDIQQAARKLCGATGLGASAAFRAIVKLTELVEELFIGARRAGEVELSVVRVDGRLGLKVKARIDDGASGGPLAVQRVLELG